MKLPKIYAHFEFFRTKKLSFSVIKPLTNCISVIKSYSGESFKAGGIFERFKTGYG